MKTTFLAWVLLFCPAGAAWGEEPVHFTDPILKAGVEEELWITDPTPADMLGLTSLSLNEVPVRDLTGLEYALNLVSLEMTRNEIHDISVLSGLTSLQTLVLNNNYIHDISVVAGLTGLEHLDIHNNEITDIAPVAGLIGLHTVILRINQISNLTPLSGLKDLEWLDLRNNQISDVTPLAGLEHLRRVYLDTNRITDMSPLTGLTALSRLSLETNPLNEQACEVYIPLVLANNPGIDFTYPTCAPVRLLVTSTAGGSVIWPGEGEFTYRENEMVPVEVQADPFFVFVGLSGSYPSLSNPTYVMVDHDSWIRANFLSVLDTLHVDDDAPADLGPGDPTVSDPHENGTPDHPFDSIQETIAVAPEGATIVVHPGRYRENVDCLGKSIQLLGVGPDGSAGPPCPVLEAGEAGPALSFGAREGLECRLQGFVITRGRHHLASAVQCRQAAVTLANCLIVGNRSTRPDGAAIHGSDSRIVVINCTIADNEGWSQSAAVALVDSDLTMTNCILWNNTSQQVSGTGTLDIRYCAVRGWWADVGNISADPLFAQRGGWVNPDNPAEVLPADDTRGIWMAGDYHLQSAAGRWQSQVQDWTQDSVSSPCIDAGDPASPIGSEPVPNGRIVNMGAYGGTAEASKSP
jgi:hypothetical protein